MNDVKQGLVSLLEHDLYPVAVHLLPDHLLLPLHPAELPGPPPGVLVEDVKFGADNPLAGLQVLQLLLLHLLVLPGPGLVLGHLLYEVLDLQ